MADKPEKPKPTYEALQVENAALRARVGRLEAEIGRRDVDAEVAQMKLRSAKIRRMLDPEAKSPLDRPWDGR